MLSRALIVYFVFFFNDTATTEIYTLSLHDALPISPRYGVPSPSPRSCRSPPGRRSRCRHRSLWAGGALSTPRGRDRKSTRLNSSHANISYAVFCLKKKKIYTHDTLNYKESLLVLAT